MYSFWIEWYWYHSKSINDLFYHIIRKLLIRTMTIDFKNMCLFIWLIDYSYIQRLVNKMILNVILKSNWQLKMWTNIHQSIDVYNNKKNWNWITRYHSIHVSSISLYMTSHYIGTSDSGRSSMTSSQSIVFQYFYYHLYTNRT